MFFKVIGIVLLLVFYGCYLLKMYKQNKAGIVTDIMMKGKKKFKMSVEVLLRALTVAVPLIELVGIFFDKTVPHDITRLVGLLLAVTGTVIFVLAVAAMGDNWRVGIPENDETQLVTKGVYRISRNPAALGFYLLYLGMVIMFFSIPLLIVSVLTMIMFHLQIVNVEEDYMIMAFGDEYLTYRKQVNRYFGRKEW